VIKESGAGRPAVVAERLPLGLEKPRGAFREAASRQVVYEQDRRAILAFVALQAAIIATSTVASGLGGANVLAITSRLM
jgi:hypothetical protein